MFKFFKKNKKQDLLGDAHKVMKGTLKVKYDYEGYSKKNIFNSLSKNSDYGFYYWPYGYLFRHFKWGTVNDLGFREKYNFNEINEVYKDFYKIGFFGGSTGFDIFVKDSDTIVSKLENKINNDQDILNKIGKVKIINFSQCGNSILTEILNYVQFGGLVDLNLIISHGPVNDFIHMQINDPTLVKNYKISYTDVLEAWGRKIHDADDIDIEFLHADVNRPDFKPVKPKSSPDDILNTYVFRTNQFYNLVKGTGKKFISSLQPWITSKQNLSKKELEFKDSYNPFYQQVYKNVPMLYEKFVSTYSKQLSHIPCVNIHEVFKNLSNKTDHFGDVCHLQEPGNEVSANEYFKKFKQLILG